ncbi:MAG: dephospho-CoA kinase [Candidatus Latescibacteria bacterium]|nr:dephospho-CoA kinase [Candidatus Latescibacterota bacterium]
MVVGLTGGMGAGKSSLGRLLESKGAHLIDADQVVHQILIEPAVQTQLMAAFGDDIVVDGHLDRRLLGQRAFASATKKEQLEAIVHPPVAQSLWAGVEASTAAIVLVDAPLLFEWGRDLDRYDAVVVIDADEDLRIQRVVQRSGLSPDQVRQRMAAQMPAAQKRARADWVVENNGTEAKLEAAAERLWQWLAGKEKSHEPRA